MPSIEIKPPLRWWEVVLIVAGVWAAILVGLPAYLHFCQWVDRERTLWESKR